MMMEPAKPASKPTTTASTESSVAAMTNVTPEQRMRDLERRLNRLDVDTITNTNDLKNQSIHQAEGSKNNNPLLARIMAAQERAKEAEKREKQEKSQKLEMEENGAERVTANKQPQYVHKTPFVEASQLKQNNIQRELERKSVEVPTMAVPIMKSMDEAPRSLFDIGTQLPLQYCPPTQTLSQYPPPPSFDFVEQQLLKPVENTGPTPSAPTNGEDSLDGILPVPPPLTDDATPSIHTLPPSFAEFEQQQHHPSSSLDAPCPHVVDQNDSFDFDIDGVPLSPEERRQMMEEQQRLYETIMNEKVLNDAAIALASADAFDSRSVMARQAERMDMAGRQSDQSGSIMKKEEPQIDGERELTTAVAQRRETEPRFVKIGNSQTVALHGQERTKQAIKEGTAILVQCINCQNWMQVTDTATLMFCPVCQVVSPVIQQEAVLTKEEAIQLTIDRKLAEKLQAEAYESDKTDETKKTEEKGYFARLFGASDSGVVSTAAQPTVGAAGDVSTMTWWDKISSIVSYGVAEEETKERGDLGVTRPPGVSSVASSASTISSYPGLRRHVNLTSVNVMDDRSTTDNAYTEETRGLLHPTIYDGNEVNLPPGRVAEQRPLLSCVYDSVSNAASAVFSTREPGVNEGENVYGVDSRSLLDATEREDRNGLGNYSQLKD